MSDKKFLAVGKWNTMPIPANIAPLQEAYKKALDARNKAVGEAVKALLAKAGRDVPAECELRTTVKWGKVSFAAMLKAESTPKAGTTSEGGATFAD